MAIDTCHTSVLFRLCQGKTKLHLDSICYHLGEARVADQAAAGQVVGQVKTW
jgi:hypothetical protein